MTNEEEFKRWFAQAKRDLDAAEASKQANAFEWSCFQSQQAAEKALKAFLYVQGERIVAGHSIFKLLERCASYEASFNELALVKRLDEVYITSRYPNSLDEGIPGEFYTAEDAEECLSLAKRVLEFVSRRGVS